MLDRLPRELLDHILKLAAPPPILAGRYCSNSRTLEACSRVCSAMRPAAQALLGRNIVFNSAPSHHGGERSTLRVAELLPRARSLYLTTDNLERDLEVLLPALSAVQEVHVCADLYGMDVSALRRIGHKLRTFSITCTSVAFSGPPLELSPFTRLVILYLDGVGAAETLIISGLATPTVLPALRVFVIHLSVELDLDVTPLARPFSRELLDQLDFLQISDDGIQKCLFNLLSFNPALPRLFWVVYDHHALICLYSEVAAGRSPLPSHLAVRYDLPRTSYEAGIEFGETRELGGVDIAGEPIVRACKEKAVHLVIGTREEAYWPGGISGDLWWYAKRIRAEDEARTSGIVEAV